MRAWCCPRHGEMVVQKRVIFVVLSGLLNKGPIKGGRCGAATVGPPLLLAPLQLLLSAGCVAAWCGAACPSGVWLVVASKRDGATDSIYYHVK
jgi:hypothetical protein